MRESVIRQVLALRSAAATVVEQADAILAAIDEEADAPPAPLAVVTVPAPTPAGCKHSSDMRQDTTTGGGSKPSFFCTGCRRTSDEIAADEKGD